MGLLCSKSSTLSGGDTVLGSVAPEQTKVPRPRPRVAGAVAAPAATDKRRKPVEGVSSTLSGGHTVLGSTATNQPNAPDPRIAAAEAADRRREADRNRGTSSSNPQRGKLSSQLETSKTAPKLPEPKQEERIVWD